MRFRAREVCLRLTRDPRGRLLLTAPRELGPRHADAFLRGWAEAGAIALRPADDAAFLRRAEAWAADFAARLALPLPAVSLADSRRWWGLCRTAEGAVRLNRRLCRMPDGAGREALLHEVCHLRETDHSAAFWQLMDTTMPDWPYWEGVLRCLGDRLRAERS